MSLQVTPESTLMEIGERLTPEQFRIISAALPKAESVWIYVIQAGGHGGLIKIGRTGNLKRRLKELQHASAERLRVVGAWRGVPELEKVLHARYAGARVHGEWFLPATPLLRLARDFNIWDAAA